MKVEIKDKELKTLLNKLKAKTTNLRDIMRDIAVYMKSEVLKNFKAQGRPRWKDLSEAAKRQKIRSKGTAYPILEFTGRLKQSINSQFSHKEARVFSGVKYGVYHQTGTRKMPARPFMPTGTDSNIPPFDEHSLEKIKSLLLEYFKKVME